MFSYRHAFHAGNHADVLKHIALLAVLRHMTQKETAIHFFDSHAGAGLYRLDGDYAQTSGEAAHGFLQLVDALHKPKDSAEPFAPTQRSAALAPALHDYLELVSSFNSAGKHRVYPGSPFIMQRLLRERDRLRLFELHPTDAKALRANVAQLDAGRCVTLAQEDGFDGLKKFLPPPSRRALVLCDPSYELKTDYSRVVAMMTDALKRFPTGTYLVWYPIIPRPEAHALPRKLKTLSNGASRAWLNATLTVKSSKLGTAPDGSVLRPGLPASGIFVINPPHTLKATLSAALAQVSEALGQDKNQAYGVQTSG